DTAVEGEHGSGGAHRQVFEEPAARSAAERVAQRIDREIGRAADPGGAFELQPPPDRVVSERDRRVQRLEVRGGVQGTELERIAQRDPAVDRLDGLNLDRPSRTGRSPVARLALDQRREIPASVRQPGAGDVRAHEADAADDDAPLKQLTDAVSERDLFDPDERVAVPVQADVPELKPAENRAVEAADGKRRGQIPVGLADDQIAQTVFCPTGLDEDKCEQDQSERITATRPTTAFASPADTG